MAIYYPCEICHDLIEQFASKQLDHLHYLILLKCGHYQIKHEPGPSFNDPTQEMDYLFEIKLTERGYWLCDHCLKRHCHKCDGESKVYCCKCYQEKYDPFFTPDKWCEFCRFWYAPICSNCGEIESENCCNVGHQRFREHLSAFYDKKEVSS